MARNRGQWERLKLCYEALEAHLAPRGGDSAEGGPAIQHKFPLNVLKDTYDHSCY